MALLFFAVLGLCSGAAGQQAGAPRFDIDEYRIEGNSLLNSEAIELAVTPHMGEQRSLVDVEAARASLERRYHGAGYLTVLVSIPDQNVDGGVVLLQVTEATVSRLRVVGAEFHLPSQIRQNLSEVEEGKVPNFIALQKALGEVNRAGDLKVAPVLKPGRAPGTVEVQLDVDDQLPLHGSLELNNRAALNTSATRLAGSLRYDNLWHQGHSLALNAQISPQHLSESRTLSANYLLPVGGEGDAMSFYGVSSRSEFATIYNSPGLGVLGNAQIAGVRYSMPTASVSNFAQAFTFGADYKNIQQSLSLSGLAAPSPAVRYLPLSASYRATWLADQPQPTSFDLSAVLGLRGLAGNSDASFDAKRPGASANFIALRSSFQKSLAVQRWTLNARLEGQLASGPLLPSEQFVAGGVESVRGFLEGERTGDNAARVSVELAGPQLKLEFLPGNWRARGVAFFDEALLMTRHARVGQPARTALSSGGVGLRLAGPRGASMLLDAARTLSDGDVGAGGTRAAQWRVHGRVSMEF